MCAVLSRSVISNSLDPMDCNPPGTSVHGDSPGKNTGVGCHALLQGIFPTQGSNPGLTHCKQILYRLSHQGSSISPTMGSNHENTFYTMVMVKQLISDFFSLGFNKPGLI